VNSNLIFFNKDGYPHNFQYNQDTEAWEGKIIFDENSSDTFKTQSLHIFENVEPIEFGFDCNLVNLNYNNNSGLTITGEVSFSNESITNITKVNESNEFYSKWIFGNNFHKKFPMGTIIYFSGVTGTTSYSSDFSDDQYFTVLSVKKNAIMIITNTSNDIFNFTFISGSTSSLNAISINDYNRQLSGETFFQNLYEDKKFSIINSNFNDTIVSIKKSGETWAYLNNIRLSDGINGKIFTLRINFLTERPKILQGDVKITENKYLELGRFSYLLAPEITYVSGLTQYIKKEIIFEDSTGGTLYNGYTFVVDSLVDKVYLGTKSLTFKKYKKTLANYGLYKTTQWNIIQYNGYLNLKKGDIIKLSGSTTPLTTGYTYHMNNRDFYVGNVTYDYTRNLTSIFTPDYIIDESGSTYSITLQLQPHQIKKVEVTPSADASAFNNILIKDAYCYLTTTYLDFSQSYNSGASFTIDTFIDKYKSALYSYGIDIYHSIINNLQYLSVESLYGTKSKYFYATGYNNDIQIANNYTFSSVSLSGLTTKYDIITNEKLYNERTNRMDTSKLYRSQISSEIALYLNYSTDRFGFRLTLNGNQYYIQYTDDTQTTINNFIDTYGTILYSNGYTVNSGYSVQYTGYTLNIISDIDIWDIEVMVNIVSSYTIINHERNNAILLSGNEIKKPTGNLFDIGLSTGMIIKVSNSIYNENNKEYNIISLTDDTIGLSYQGVFISETGATILGLSREFIRKPRGEYNRDVYLRVFWETPYDNNIDNSIFLYDITGDQLIPYNNNPSLTYLGQKPLIDLSNNVVFLNKNANKDLDKIYNPKYQQTVFDELTFKLEQLDSSLSYNWIPEPLEIFIGYSTQNEGVNSRVLKIEKIEKIENITTYFSYSGYTNSGLSYSTPNFIFNYDTLEYKAPIDFNFISYGFVKDQIIKFTFKDQSKKNQRIFENVYTYKILELGRNKIIIDTGYTYDNTGFTYFTTTGTTFFFNIEVQPKEILSCSIFGQTEVEDIRYKVNLNNVGVQLEDDIYQILYQSDIQDNAIDYILLNRKRKEMLTTFREIYDYIGSYKSLINSINFFGYNNLQLFEYYRNIDKQSILFEKLHKVLIPDIFDNSVQGWNEMDFIAGKYQNQNTWKKTNLFNLAYQITDEDGNNVLIYSLEDVQYKLTKLKTWLRKNIIPISANLLDITGVADTNQTLYQNYDESNQTKKSVVERNSTVVNFNYTASLNFETDYLITVNFYILSGLTSITTAEVPDSFSAKIKTFYLSGDTMIPVQYFKIMKNDLTSFSFNLNKYIDPYIYIETTTYDNSGNGLGFVNNKMFYFDEPRNWWLVTHNFDMSKFKFYQTMDYITNQPQKWQFEDIVTMSTAVSSSVETNVQVNTLNDTYLSKIEVNNKKDISK